MAAGRRQHWLAINIIDLRRPQATSFAQINQIMKDDLFKRFLNGEQIASLYCRNDSKDLEDPRQMVKCSSRLTVERKIDNTTTSNVNASRVMSQLEKELTDLDALMKTAMNELNLNMLPVITSQRHTLMCQIKKFH